MMQCRTSADPIGHIFLKKAVSHAFVVGPACHFGLVSKTMQHENRFRMDQIRGICFDASRSLGGYNFNRIAVFDSCGCCPLGVYPEHVFRHQFVEIRIVLGRDMGMHGTTSHDQAELSFRGRRHGFIGGEGFKPGVLQHGGDKFDPARRRLELNPFFSVPDYWLVSIAHKPFFIKIFHCKSGAFQLPFHQVFHGFVWEKLSHSQPLGQLFEDYGEFPSVPALRNGLPGEVDLGLDPVDLLDGVGSFQIDGLGEDNV